MPAADGVCRTPGRGVGAAICRPGNGWAAVAAASGVWLPPGGIVHAGCAPHFLFRLAEKKTGCTRKGYAASVSGKAANGCAIARSKRKGRFWRAPVQRPSARTGVGVPVQAPIWAVRRARFGLLRFLQLHPRGGWCRRRRGGCRIDQRQFSLPLAWRGTEKRADEGIRPYGTVQAFGIPVGADALIGPPHSPLQLPGQRVAERNARKEKQIKSVLATRCRRHPAAGTSRRIGTHPAAPVGEPSQTRRHHLSSTLVQRGGAKAPERG